MPTLKLDCLICDGLSIRSYLVCIANNAVGQFIAPCAHDRLRLNLLNHLATSVADLLLQRSNYGLPHQVG